MGKFIAKFRKERDYDDDYDYGRKTKKMGKHERNRKQSRVEHDIFLNDDVVLLYKTARRKPNQS